MNKQTHSALAYRTPAEFEARFHARRQDKYHKIQKNGVTSVLDDPKGLSDPSTEAVAPGVE